MVVITNPIISDRSRFIINSIHESVRAASSCISTNDAISATIYLGAAAGGLRAVRALGIENQQTQELSTEIQNLNDQVKKLYEKLPKPELHVGVKTKTLFPIRVTYDAGFGNTIELRGTKAAQLSWNQGKALMCKDATHWELDLDVQDSFEYKLVLRKADGTILWEKLEDNKNRIFSTDDRNVVDYLKPIFPIFA